MKTAIERECLGIHENLESGYRPLVDFEDWRVAVLNYIDEIHPDKLGYLERHLETDEVFVLLHGQAVLFLAGCSSLPGDIVFEAMQTGKVYNVRKSTWHTAVLTKDASVLIVENCDTARENSEYWDLSSQARKIIVDASRTELTGLW
jgi:hypothetical protein